MAPRPDFFAPIYKKENELHTEQAETTIRTLENSMQENPLIFGIFTYNIYVSLRACDWPYAAWMHLALIF